MQYRLEEACVKHNPWTPRMRMLYSVSATGTSLLWNYEHRLAYCPNAKTGTTTWMHVFLELVPWLNTESRDKWNGRFHIGAERLFSMPNVWPGGKELFDRLFSFVFVRHPFVRLASAYQDKVQSRVRYTLCECPVIQPTICTRFKVPPPCSRQFLLAFNALVSMYYLQIVDHAQYDFFDRDHKGHNTTYLTSKKYSFRTFVSLFLKSTKNMGIFRRYFKG